MSIKLTETQQKTLMELQRMTMDLSSKKQQLKAQSKAISMDHTAAENTLRYLQEQKDDTNVYYSIGRIFVKHEMKGSREGLAEGVKVLKGDLDQVDKAAAAIDKQLNSAQSNLIDFLKSNNIPFQQR